ncbi:MAG: zinc ribbon domain-containing protein [Phycisphaerae bacterium]
MGPTNIALVKLFRVDQDLREAQEKYDTAARSVRLLERRVAELTAKSDATTKALREQQAKAANFELEIKTRDEKIEKLRAQQSTARTNKDYQAFLTEINTEKVDKGKAEDEAMKAMESAERISAELKVVQGQLGEEQAKLDETKGQLGGRLSELQADIDRIKPLRAEAYELVPAKGRLAYDRIADRHDGDAMAPMEKPDPRYEEYGCGTCNMTLVTDVYNRLHSRDEVVLCPNCGRLLYIPADLPVDVAVHKPKEEKPKAVRKPRAPKAEKVDKSTPGVGAAVNRQTAAKAVVDSVNVEPEESAAAPDATEGTEAATGEPVASDTPGGTAG